MNEHNEYRTKILEDKLRDATMMLEHAVKHWPQFDDPDGEVNGGDAVEWLGNYRAAAKAVLKRIKGADSSALAPSE